MHKIRAQNVPWSLRQPLLALESTHREVCKGRLWISTLTEPLQLLTYFKAGIQSLGGLLRLTHVAGHVLTAGARA